MMPVAEQFRFWYDKAVRHNPAIDMSEKTKINLSIGLLWAILAGVSAGAWHAATIHQKVDRIDKRMERVEALERDMIRVKQALNLTEIKITSAYSTANNR